MKFSLPGFRLSAGLSQGQQDQLQRSPPPASRYPPGGVDWDERSSTAYSIPARQRVFGSAAWKLSSTVPALCDSCSEAPWEWQLLQLFTFSLPLHPLHPLPATCSRVDAESLDSSCKPIDAPVLLLLLHNACPPPHGRHLDATRRHLHFCLQR